MATCVYVSKKTAKKVRKPIWDILKEMNVNLDNNGIRKVNQFMIVGSSRRNMIVRHGSSEFDTDIQLYFNVKEIGDISAEIKSDVYDALALPDGWTKTISTSAIYVKGTNKDENFDLAVLARTSDQTYISRGKVKNDTDDTYKWNELGNGNEAYDKFNNASTFQRKCIKDRYLEKKEVNFHKDESEKISSSAIFIMSVNEIILD